MKASPSQNFEKLRAEMVDRAIFARGVRSELVLNYCTAQIATITCCFY